MIDLDAPITESLPELFEGRYHRAWALSTICRHGQIGTARELLQMSEAELLRIPNLGRLTLKRIEDTLARRGMKIGKVPAEPVIVCCENCFFARLQEHNDFECHRYAPRPPSREVRYLTMWPIVRADDLCGEFREHEK